MLGLQGHDPLPRKMENLDFFLFSPDFARNMLFCPLSQVGLAPSFRSSLHSLWTRGKSFSAKLYEIPGIPHRFPEIYVINCPFCVKYVLFDKFSYFLIKIPDIPMISGIPMGFLQAMYFSLLNGGPFVWGLWIPHPAEKYRKSQIPRQK